jgi:hypothetical protein
MVNVLQAVPIIEPHIPDEIDDEGIRAILECMTWGASYRVSDRIAIMDPTPDLQAELGLCWIDKNCPGAATVYFDGKPFAMQDVKWIEAQFEKTNEYKLTGVPSGRVHYPRGTDGAEYQAGA